MTQESSDTSTSPDIKFAALSQNEYLEMSTPTEVLSTTESHNPKDVYNDLSQDVPALPSIPKETSSIIKSYHPKKTQSNLRLLIFTILHPIMVSVIHIAFLASLILGLQFTQLSEDWERKSHTNLSVFLRVLAEKRREAIFYFCAFMAVSVMMYHFARPTRPWSGELTAAPNNPDTEVGSQSIYERRGVGNLEHWMKGVWVFIFYQWFTTLIKYEVDKGSRNARPSHTN